jgi:hypothetical protein
VSEFTVDLKHVNPRDPEAAEKRCHQFMKNPPKLASQQISGETVGTVAASMRIPRLGA